jgi:CheY-like chemotaxis protein
MPLLRFGTPLNGASQCAAVKSKVGHLGISMATILIVDDLSANRQLLVTLLRHHGHRVLEAADGRAGLAAVQAEHPDLVIPDVLMPVMDGYQFVSFVLSASPARHRANCQPPFDALTPLYVPRSASEASGRRGHSICSRPWAGALADNVPTIARASAFRRRVCAVAIHTGAGTP